MINKPIAMPNKKKDAKLGVTSKILFVLWQTKLHYFFIQFDRHFVFQLFLIDSAIIYSILQITIKQTIEKPLKSPIFRPKSQFVSFFCSSLSNLWCCHFGMLLLWSGQSHLHCSQIWRSMNFLSKVVEVVVSWLRELESNHL